MKTKTNLKVIVIGGGAAGLMAAGTAASRGHDVLLLEKKERVGRKLVISGKGRCNITNDTDIDGLIQNTPGNGCFLYSTYYQFSNTDLMNFFEGQGVSLKVERGGRVFPVSDNAKDIVDTLRHYVTSNGARISEDTPVKRILTETLDPTVVGAAQNSAAGSGTVGSGTVGSAADGSAADSAISGSANGSATVVVGVELENGKHLYADKVIIATGGASYTGTGSSGDGSRFARDLGHRVNPLRPSLVPLLSDAPWVKELQGLSLKNVAVTFRKGKKKIYSDFGEMLFTHYGVSGPLVLSASRHLLDFDYSGIEMSIDLKPALDEKKLDERILRDFSKNPNKQFCNSLDELLPQKMIPIMVRLSEISPDKQVNSVTKEERRRLVHLFKDFAFSIDGSRPLQEAIVTVGGVDTDEINPSTMESKLVSGLYFAGEVIDVDAYTGGFNLTIAFSTGHTAGMNV